MREARKGLAAIREEQVMKTRTAWAIAAVCVLVGQYAAAQGLTGALLGTVIDEQGAVLPGARVRLSSPALIGGPVTMATNERGQLRFPVLWPGAYTIDIDLSGFAPLHEEGIEIGAGATLSRTVILKVAGVADSIVVEGAGSRIDARGTGVETRIGSDYLRAIPSRRYSMFDGIRAAPGVSPTSPTSGTVNTVAAFGSGGNENLFLIDGTNFTCPCSGVARAEPSVDVIQEIQVQSVGVSVEYGNIQGSVFNVVTKQGGDRAQYDASYYGQASGLTSQPVLLPVSGTQTRTGYERDRYRDFTTDLGGPLVRGRAWFFTGYQYLRDYDSQPGTDPALPRKYEQNKIFGKVTWKLGRNMQLVQSFNDERWVSPQTPTRVTPFEATQRQNAWVPTTTFGQLTHTPSPNTVWDLRVGRFVYSRHDDPSTGSWTTPNRFDQVTGVSSGNAPQLGSLTLKRTSARATLSHNQRGFAGGDHEWKFGGSFEIGEHTQPQIIPGGVRYVDNNGQPFQSVSSPPSNVGGRFVTSAAFGSDTMTIGSRVAISAGVRFDRSRAESQDLHAIDGYAHETDEIIHGLGTLYTWNVFSPRVGATVKLTADGRTMARGSYGRFYQGVLTGELSGVHPGLAPVTTMAFDANTGGYTKLVSVVDPTMNVRIDRAMRTPHTDEFSIGVDRELRRLLRAEIAAVHKSGADYIGWTDIGGRYSEEPRTLPDLSTIRVFNLQSGTASRVFLLTNPDGYSMRYDGLVVSMDKRRANGWQALGSYTFSRTSGLQASSGVAAADAQVSTIAPNGTFGRDPNNLTNAYGKLPNDRPNMFRAMGTMDVPHTGVMLAANLQYFTGKPWAATTQVTLNQGSQRILLEPRGSERLASQTILDLRVSRPIRAGRFGRIELVADVLNALNSRSAEAIASDNKFSPTFGQPTVFVDPRRAMLSVRFNVGR
jgi:hypothetical protein